MKILISDSSKSEKFTSIFEHLRIFSTHINIHFKTEGMYIQGMDSCHASMFEVNIPATWFDAYTNTENQILGINATIFYKILNTREKKQSIEIKFESATDKMEISFIGGEKSEYAKHFVMPLVDLTNEMFEVPEIEYQVEMGFEAKALGSLIDQLALFGDVIVMKCNEEQVQFTSNGIDGTMSVDIPMDDLAEYAIEEGKEVSLSYSIKYLHNMCLFHKLSKEVSINISDEYPMKLIYNFAEGSYVKFYLAPRVSLDEEY